MAVNANTSQNYDVPILINKVCVFSCCFFNMGMYHGALNKYKQKDIRNMLYLAFFLNIKVKFCLKMTSFSLINDLNHDKKEFGKRNVSEKKPSCGDQFDPSVHHQRRQKSTSVTSE